MIFQRTIFVCAVAAGVMLGLSATAEASVTFYSSPAAFAAAAPPGLVTETFAELAADVAVGPSGSAILSHAVVGDLNYPGMVEGASYMATTGLITLVGPEYGSPTFSLPGYSLFPNNFNTGIQISLPFFTAVSLDVESLALVNGTDVTVSVYGDGSQLLGSTTVLGYQSGPSTFLGMTTSSSTPIAYLVLTDSLGQPGFTDVSFGGQVLNPQGGSVPEPATWAMLILGLAGIGAAARYRSALAAA